MSQPLDRRLKPIGTLRSDYREKFGIPRQPGLAPSGRATLTLQVDPDSVDGLEKFSHLWLIYLFHDLKDYEPRPKVRPPRLGGAKKIGVLASRSPHRPNPIGLSAVRLEHLHRNEQGQPVLELSGVDLLDGTPVLDIKPYVPYADSIPDAAEGWAPRPERRLQVGFSEEADVQIGELERAGYTRLRQLVEQTLSLDPRPAFQSTETNADYAMRLMDFDVHWRVEESLARVLFLRDLRESRG